MTEKIQGIHSIKIFNSVQNKTHRFLDPGTATKRLLFPFKSLVRISYSELKKQVMDYTKVLKFKQILFFLSAIHT